MSRVVGVDAFRDAMAGHGAVACVQMAGRAITLRASAGHGALVAHQHAQAQYAEGQAGAVANQALPELCFGVPPRTIAHAVVAACKKSPSGEGPFGWSFWRHAA